MNNKHSVVESFVFRESGPMKWATPPHSLWALSRIAVWGKSAKERELKQMVQMEHVKSPDLLSMSSCHPWSMCTTRFIFLQQTYKNTTFLYHRNVATALAELLGGLVILIEELLTPSSALKAAECNYPMITRSTLFPGCLSSTVHFLDAFLFH